MTERVEDDRADARPVYVSHLAPILAAADAQRDRDVATLQRLVAEGAFARECPDVRRG